MQPEIKLIIRKKIIQSVEFPPGIQVSIKDYDTQKFNPSFLEEDDKGNLCRHQIWQWARSSDNIEVEVVIKKGKTIINCPKDIKVTTIET